MESVVSLAGQHAVRLYGCLRLASLIITLLRHDVVLDGGRQILRARVPQVSRRGYHVMILLRSK